MRTRRGLVLGAGGVLGAAWSVGALASLREVTGWDPTVDQPEVLIGTSAGSVLVSMLACGTSLDALIANQRGESLPEGPSLDYRHDDAAGALPPRPHLRIGSRGLLRAAVRHPRRMSPTAALTALLPEGRGSLDPVRHLVEQALAELGGAQWPESPATWVVAMDYDTGRRVVFGREGSPTATLPDAVVASCSIPAWYAPVPIDGRRYVDGGVCSSTSVDLLAGAGLDEVWVLAPMADAGLDRPRSTVARLERRYRRTVTRRMEREADKVRATGTAVHLIAPGPHDLTTMGANLMDPTRRKPVFEASLATTAEAIRLETAEQAAS
jgi:NTE family protein